MKTIWRLTLISLILFLITLLLAFIFKSETLVTISLAPLFLVVFFPFTIILQEMAIFAKK